MKKEKPDNSYKEKKFYITIECSSDDYEKLKRVSSTQNQKIEDYVLDKALKARNRKNSNNKENTASTAKRQKTRNKSRKIATAMVRLQQNENDLRKKISRHENNEEELKLMEDNQERMDQIWDS